MLYYDTELKNSIKPVKEIYQRNQSRQFCGEGATKLHSYV
jgi:hypothetical protein